jgi:Tol biopolymer transport system component
MTQDLNGKIVFAENSKLVIYDNDTRNILENLGEGNFAWPSISPDNTKLLFTKAGEGTFVSDLNGNILVELGYANAPVWSPDSKWIAYMVDSDNGYFYTASDVYVVSSDGEKKYQLTDTEYSIEMYPQWAPDGTKIAFHTTNGIIKILQLEID